MLKRMHWANARTNQKLLLLALGAAVGLLIFAAAGLLLFFDINDYKSRIETAISAATGMSVTIEGPLGLTLRPDLRVELKNVRVRNKELELAFVKEVDVAIPFAGLFQNEIRYSRIDAVGAHISVVLGSDGTYNYERRAEDTVRSRPLELPRVSFADTTVVYTDMQSENRVEFRACTGQLIDLRNPGGERFLKRLSATGKASCGEVLGKGESNWATALNVSLVAVEGVFDFEPLTLKAYGGQVTAKLRMDRSQDVPALELRIVLPQFQVEELLMAHAPGASRTAVSGLMNFSANVSMRGTNRLALRQSAQGEISLSGSNLKLVGQDLDGQLRKFESSQSLSLFDVSALLIAGPVSLLVTKGYELARPSGQNGSQSTIRNLISRWKVEKGVARAVDVALTTNENRIAAQGSLDFVRNEYQDVVVALLDASGCAKARQKISGSFAKPVADRSIILLPLGSILNLLDRAKALLTGGTDKCEIFYSGTLTAPQKTQSVSALFPNAAVAYVR